jgi:RHS repeat-associated protein
VNIRKHVARVCCLATLAVVIAVTKVDANTYYYVEGSSVGPSNPVVPVDDNQARCDQAAAANSSVTTYSLVSFSPHMPPHVISCEYCTIYVSDWCTVGWQDNGVGNLISFWRLDATCPEGTQERLDHMGCVRSEDSQKNLGACPVPGQCPSPHVGNPINAATGNKYQREVDYQSPARQGLTFVRHYNSAAVPNVVSGQMGPKWRHNFDRRLFVDPGFEVVDLTRNPPLWVRPAFERVVVIRADGRELEFWTWRYRPRQAGTELFSDSDVPERLIYTGTGFQLYTPDDEIETYDTDGKLRTVSTRNGYQQTLEYNAAGRLSRIYDSYNRELTFQYRADGLLEVVTDPAGSDISYAYNNGYLESVTYSDGKTRRYTYTGAFLSDIEDENGAAFAHYEYDAEGRATVSVHAGDADRVEVTYNANGTTTVEDALGASRLHTYRKFWGLFTPATITQSCPTCSNSTMTVEHDNAGFVSRRTDLNGNATTYQHNSRGLETQRIEALGTSEERTITTQWHATHRVPTQIDEPGRRTTYTYDASGNRLTQTITDTATGEARTTTWTYTAQGLVDTVNGPRTDVSDITDYDYDAQGNLIRITNALNQITEIPEHDAHGNPKKIVDPNGVITTLTYDLRQRLKTVTAAGATTTLDYDGVGQLDKVTLPDGSFLDYTYDGAHRLTDVEDNLGNKIHYTLNAMGGREKEEVFDPSGTLRRKQSQVFDALGRLDQVKNAAGEVVSDYGYDAQGNRTSLTEAGLYTTSYTPDALNRIESVLDAGSGTTQYGYNALGQLTSVTDPENLTTSYGVNALGDVKQQASPDTGVTTYTYDAAGNRKTQLDARGVTVAYAYDALNRLTFVDYPGTAEDVTYFYDGTNYSGTVANGIGRLTGIQDESGTTTIVYHPRGTVASESKVILGQTYVTQYTYDATDRLSTITYPSGRVIALTRNSAGQVTRVASTLGTSVEVLADAITYRPYGPATSWTLGNGIAVSRSFDPNYRIDGITAGTVQNVTIGYETRRDNIASIANNLDAMRSQGFTYDALSRLDTASGIYGSLDYGYDAVGNRETETRSGATDTYAYVPNSHRLAAIAGATNVSFAYDAAGNATQKGADALAYNNAGRLKQLTRNGLAVGSYTYNASGQRVVKNAAGISTVYHYDTAGNLVAETTSTGVVLAEYAYLDGQPLAYFAATAPGLAGLLPTALSTHYFHVDHLGTPQYLTDNTGAVVWSADYEPFGKVSVALSSSRTQSLRFPGQYYDAETGLHDNWWRTYDPGSGRYLQSDPIGLMGGLSTYGYGYQNPLKVTDPEGLSGAIV